MECIISTKDLAYAILGTNGRGLPLLQNGLHLPLNASRLSSKNWGLCVVRGGLVGR